MRLPLWLDVDWEYEDGGIHLKSVKCYEEEMLPNLKPWEIEKIKQHCLEKQKEMWAEERA